MENVTIFGKSIFDFYDYASGNILFMLTALGCAIFVGFVLKDEAKKNFLQQNIQLSSKFGLTT